MNKKSVSATILILFLALTFSVIGSCFMNFVYKETKIELKNINIIANAGVDVFDDDKLSNKINKLNFSEVKLGLKPATGELDAETEVPSTITDDNSSEGCYSTVYVKASAPFKIVINNISIINSVGDSENERKNIFVSIKNLNNSTNSLENDEIKIASFDDVSNANKIVFLFWLGSLSGEELVGAQISFDVNFILL